MNSALSGLSGVSGIAGDASASLFYIYWPDSTELQWYDFTNMTWSV